MMVTITAPSSNPTPTYNRSGITIDMMSPGVASSAAAPIVRAAGTTVVMVRPSTTGEPGWVMLPADAEVGDVVEVYPLVTFSSPATRVATPTGVMINNFFTQGLDGTYRLLTATSWGGPGA